MSAKRPDIIARLQKEILNLQGFKPALNNTEVDTGLGPIKHAFPGNSFPFGAIHEFLCGREEEASASIGFIAGILTTLMKGNGISLWVSASRSVYPPALISFGIDPDKFIFVDLEKERDVLWAMEESLRCDGLAAVIGEIREIPFTASRRLQLAVEQSRVTGFILRRNPKQLNSAFLTRWKITSLPSILTDGMPGVGFPRWNVELLKVRNGKPGSWEIEWINGRFRHPSRIASIPADLERKTG